MNTPKLLITGLALATLAVSCTPTPKPVDETRMKQVEITNLRQPAPGVLTGGQPTPEQLDALSQMGVMRFINLRADGERGTGWEADAIAKMGGTYTHIPVVGPEGISEENARKLADAMEGDGPVLVYCGSSNRVGALMGLKAKVVDGMSAADAKAFGKKCGATRLEQLMNDRIDG